MKALIIIALIISSCSGISRMQDSSMKQLVLSGVAMPHNELPQVYVIEAATDQFWWCWNPSKYLWELCWHESNNTP